MRFLNNKNKLGGAVLVEFALTAPILFLLIFACMEFGSYLYYKQIITHASLQGARYLAQQGHSINQTKEFILENLGATGINTKNIVLKSYDSDPTCKREQSTVSVEIKIPYEQISLTGDPLNFFKNNNYLGLKIIMQKECIES